MSDREEIEREYEEAVMAGDDIAAQDAERRLRADNDPLIDPIDYAGDGTF